MSIIPSAASLFVARNSRSASYQIEQSLRFNSADSTYLSRTTSGFGITTTCTISWWHKKAAGSTSNTHWMCGSYPNMWSWESTDTSSNGFRWTNNGGTVFGPSGSKYRDYSGWYHWIVTQSGTVSKVYLNGKLLRQDNTNSGSSATNWYIGAEGGTDNHLNGYLAEFHFLDGTAVTDATAFGEFDDNGVWRPIEYTGGNYGTDGFYLKFDPSATNGIGHDHSGNGNNFTANNFTTSGTGTDVMSDTPTNNFATLNPLEPASASAGTLSDGNLYIANQDYSLQKATFRFGGGGPTTGKYYWEVTHTGGNYTSYIGVTSNLTQDAGEIAGGQDKSWFGNNSTRQFTSGSSGSYTHTYSSGDVHGYAIDLDAQEIKYYINGTLKFTDSTLPDPATTVLVPFQFTTFSGSGVSWTNTSWNFGQRAFSHQPTGYSSLCTSNLPAPTIKNGSKYFNTVLYTGNGSNASATQAITGVGFQPDFLWIKGRSVLSGPPVWDAVRGVSNRLFTNSTAAENTSGDWMSSFDTDGFTVKGDANNANASGESFVAWNWKAGGSGSSNTDGTITSTVSASAESGFSIVTYSGNNTLSATVGHGLGVTPDLVMIKDRSTSNYVWMVKFGILGGEILEMPGTRSASATSSYSTGTVGTLTSTTFGFATGSGLQAVNNTGQNYLAYCFSGVEGYSKFGSYTGNNSSDGAFVYTGFAPAFVMIKADESANWVIYDTSRSPYNVADEQLSPNTNGIEVTNDGNADLLSNGFKFRNGAATTNAYTYVYAAFASNPFGGSGVSPATAR